MARPSGLVRPGWEVVVVCASGPSFDEAQAAEVVEARERRCARVIVVNDNWQRVPNADLLYAHDGRWYRVHIDALRAGFGGELWTQDTPAARKYGLTAIAQKLKPGLTKTSHTIHGGGNSGYGAINLAYLFGARRIVLVGFDMQRTGGRAHWFGDHAHPDLKRGSPFAEWIGRFGDLARDLAAERVDCVNASRETALNCFRRLDLDVALCLPLSPA